jgi:hypothetical protein
MGFVLAEITNVHTKMLVCFSMQVAGEREVRVHIMLIYSK